LRECWAKLWIIPPLCSRQFGEGTVEDFPVVVDRSYHRRAIRTSCLHFANMLLGPAICQFVRLRQSSLATPRNQHPMAAFGPLMSPLGHERWSRPTPAVTAPTRKAEVAAQVAICRFGSLSRTTSKALASWLSRAERRPALALIATFGRRRQLAFFEVASGDLPTATGSYLPSHNIPSRLCLCNRRARMVGAFDFRI
jgi:hypothetical protein